MTHVPLDVHNLQFGLHFSHYKNSFNHDPSGHLVQRELDESLNVHGKVE